MMTISDLAQKRIIRSLLVGEDYRVEVVTLIDSEFLQYVVDFFRRVVNAKLEGLKVTADWYKNELLDDRLPPSEIAIHAGLNMKTISNMYNHAKKATVVKASLDHYEALYGVIRHLVEQETDLNVTLTIQQRGVSVELDLGENLIVINTLAVKRSALRGGIWSSAGKQVEKPLMSALCMLLRVPQEHYDQSTLPAHVREVDFYLIPQPDRPKRCEVKLMGKGNPESADVVVARESRVFVADKLSDLNKRQLNERNVLWVELRDSDALTQFSHVLSALDIPHTPFRGAMDAAMDRVLSQLFPDDTTTR
jgi:hypothetical protein